MNSPVSNKNDGDFVTSGSEADNEDLKGHNLPPEPPAWLETIFEEQIRENEQWDASKIREFNPEDVSDQWDLIENQENMKILQDLKNPNIFRCQYKFKKIKVEKVLQVLLDCLRLIC
jgi:hypothetical protein